MKYLILISSFFLIIYSYSQTKKTEQKKSQIEWTWDGKKVTESQLKDSMRVHYLRYWDSVSKKIKKP